MKTSRIIAAAVFLLAAIYGYAKLAGRLDALDSRLLYLERANAELQPLNEAWGKFNVQQVERAKAWTPAQATGKPNAGTEESLNAWCPAVEDGGEEWLLLTYEKPVAIASVKVHANYGPGAVVKVAAVGAGDSETVLWEGAPVTANAPPVLELDVKTPVTTDRIKLYLDTKSVRGWNEIDAVQLVGTDGSTQWAADAEASSFWTRNVGGTSLTP